MLYKQKDKKISLFCPKLEKLYVTLQNQSDIKNNIFYALIN